MASLAQFRLAQLRRWETLVVLLAVVLLLVWFVLERRGDDAQAETLRLERQLSTTRQQLTTLVSEGDEAALRQELEALRALPPPLELPPRSRALDFGGALFARADALGVELVSLDSEESTATLGAFDFNAIEYRLRANGTPLALTDMLELLDRFPTAVPEVLDFTLSEGRWVLEMTVSVVYRTPPAAPAAGAEEGT